MEFHIARSIRERLDVNDLLFSFTGNVVFANVAASRKLAQRLNELQNVENVPEKTIHGAAMFAMGLIDELSHALVARYRQDVDPAVLTEALAWFRSQGNPAEMERLLLQFTQQFPNNVILRQEVTAEEWLNGTSEGLSNREAAFEELMLLWLANSNPAFAPFKVLYDDVALKQQTIYGGVTSALPNFFTTRPPVAPGLGSLLDALRAPMLASPDSLTGQLDYIRERWAPYLGEDLRRVLLAIDVIREEEIAIWMRFHPSGAGRNRHREPGRSDEGFLGDEYVGFDEDFVTGPDGVRRRRYASDYQAPLHEYEAFSADQAWMPTVVLMAKSTYVWLEQLSKKYLRHIYRLDQIPDEELQLLASRGITGLWLIGLWERSRASQTIKRLCGNADAVASAYSLKDYSIAEDLGGESAYVDLRDRAARAGLRLASDMVPNHMGIDSTWVIEHPEWFLSRWETPFPSYSFEGPDLSTDSRVEIKVEDHYYDQSDAAVVFRLRHHHDGATRFMYHGNDGTTFAWNDTAQLDYSKQQVREHVIQVILDVARRFPIIRFDAAMVLAKRHVQRLWFPLPGAGGSIPSRAEDALSEEAFNELMPHEFWREVVDRVAVEVPGTLLLAEAFWLLEGYFVRTLGMHRVYNSAFMNMLRDEENAKYRSYLKKTVEFDPDILKRYVNFMSNPDERTATDQFGTGDKYFGVSVLLATLPGLPMFGHGQIEGFTERYGMDFKQARMDETPNEGLIARHQHLIAPLLKNRRLFAESTYFVMYDFWTAHGTVDENVFAYSNRCGNERGLILYNNSYESTHGTIHTSVGFLDKGSGELQQTTLSAGLALPDNGGLIVAFRDNVVGLEYLRRASELKHHGLTLPLRGYQHVALLHWRELMPTAAQPWDQLCDALNGSGVYSVEEALSHLRLRPLLDALRHTVNIETIEEFVALAARTEPEERVQTPPARRLAVQPEPSTAKAAGTRKSGTDAAVPGQAFDALTDPGLQQFVLNAAAFTQKIAEMWDSGRSADQVLPDPTEPEATENPSHVCLRLAIASLKLPNLTASFPVSLQTAVRAVLPNKDTNTSPASVWAPVLAWLAFKTLPSASASLDVFDQLNLRPAFAETFSSVGLEGECAWRAAAQVRVLLRQGDKRLEITEVQTNFFWSDPDVRWLAGVSGAFGTEFLNKERFEEFVCWLALPALLQTETQAEDVLAVLKQLTRRATEVSWNLKTFVSTEDAAEASPKPRKTSEIDVAETQPESSVSHQE